MSFNNARESGMKVKPVSRVSLSVNRPERIGRGAGWRNRSLLVSEISEASS